jgi:hypothetical protein
VAPIGLVVAQFILVASPHEFFFHFDDTRWCFFFHKNGHYQKKAGCVKVNAAALHVSKQ